MIIVPVPGDVITTATGLPYKVLSFTNYRPEGPAVLCETPSEPETIDFRDILRLGKSKVHFVKGAHGTRVLSALGAVSRKFHLPQPGSIIKARTAVETAEFEVHKLSLGVKGKLSKGLILEVTHHSNGDEMELTLNQIVDLPKTIFSRDEFLKYYADYTEKGPVRK